MTSMGRWLSCVERQPHGPGKVAKKVWIFDEVVAGAGHCPQLNARRRVAAIVPLSQCMSYPRHVDLTHQLLNFLLAHRRAHESEPKSSQQQHSSQLLHDRHKCPQWPPTLGRRGNPGSDFAGLPGWRRARGTDRKKLEALWLAGERRDIRRDAHGSGEDESQRDQNHRLEPSARHQRCK